MQIQTLNTEIYDNISIDPVVWGREVLCSGKLWGYYEHKQKEVQKMKTVDQEKLWHTCDTVMVLPTPWRQKRMGFYSIWLFMTTLNIPLNTHSPHRKNTADYCTDSCFSDIVSHEDNHRTIDHKKSR